MHLPLEVIRTGPDAIVGPNWHLAYNAKTDRRRLRLLSVGEGQERSLDCLLLRRAPKGIVFTNVLASFSPN